MKIVLKLFVKNTVKNARNTIWPKTHFFCYIIYIIFNFYYIKYKIKVGIWPRTHFFIKKHLKIPQKHRFLPKKWHFYSIFMPFSSFFSAHFFSKKWPKAHFFWPFAHFLFNFFTQNITIFVKAHFCKIKVGKKKRP